MGSDLLIRHISIPMNRKPDFEKGAKYIDRLRNTSYKKWPKEYRENFMDVPDPADEAAVLMGDLDDIHRNWIEQGRECEIIYVGNRKVFITGGFSNGDDPCDLWSTLDRFIRSGTAKACGFQS